MRKIILKESELIKLIEKTIKEQDSAFSWSSSLDGWDIQRDARDEGRYCQDTEQGGAGNFEGQHCVTQTNWYDWESSPAPKTMGVSAHGKWECGVGCVIPKGTDR